MISPSIRNIEIGESPTKYADYLGSVHASSVASEQKKANGQFFTTPEIAHFMASNCGIDKELIRILDPGCGTGVLTCALVEHLCLHNKATREIRAVLYDIDNQALEYASRSMEYLKEWCQKAKILLSYELKNSDFIIDNADALSPNISFFRKDEYFDIAISNPPYFKLNKADSRVQLAKQYVYGQPNIYSLFLLVSASLLNSKGELIFITPRSFTAGPYFKRFRDYFFQFVKLKQIHLFESRDKNFNRDKILQENIIMFGMKNGVDKRHDYQVKISFSDHSNDAVGGHFSFNINKLVDFESEDKILHLPVSQAQVNTMTVFDRWKNTLQRFNIRVSTGPVVAYRNSNHILATDTETKCAVPLIWLHNISKMTFKWPLQKQGKGQYISRNTESQPFLVPNCDYVLLRRFSAKDDKSRLIASPYLSDLNGFDLLGLENHVNYIYRPKGKLLPEEIFGISGLLNSTLFDTYFRTFNGNTQVSSTEINNLPFPDIDTICEIGSTLRTLGSATQKQIDDTVSNIIRV